MEIKRCGWCGRYYKGVDYLTDEELKGTSKILLDTAKLGNCPEAMGETGEAENHHYYDNNG